MPSEEPRPFDFLTASIGKPVLVSLKGKRELRGTLKAFDIHMNIELDAAEELEDGKPLRKVGRLLVRGDNILYVSP
jgi:small nuclear ribonucleoprotein